MIADIIANISRRNKIIITVLIILILGLLWLFYRSLPATENDMRQSVCHIDGTSRLCLVWHGDTVTIKTDEVNQQGVWVNRHWWWPSSDGRVLTAKTRPLLIPPFPSNDSLKSFVLANTDSLQQLLKRKNTEYKELQYYLRTHGVIDEGYQQIATYAGQQAQETARLSKIFNKIAKTISKKGKDNPKFVRIVNCRVSWLRDDSVRSIVCLPMTITSTVKGKSADTTATIIIHTMRSTKPWGSYAVRNVPWGGPKHRNIIVVRPGYSPSDTTHREVILVPGQLNGSRHDIPQLLAPDGAPVFSSRGRFIGIVRGKEVMP